MGEGIGGGPLGTQELDLMTPFGSLATQIFYDFIMQDIFFSVHLYYMDEKENAKIKELVHLADLVGLHVLLALGRSACVGVLFTG